MIRKYCDAQQSQQANVEHEKEVGLSTFSLNYLRIEKNILWFQISVKTQQRNDL